MAEDKNNYLVKTEELDGSEVKLIFKVPAKKLEGFVKQATEEMGQKMKLDGFRSGKIPKEIVEKEAGKDHLFQEGAEKAVKKFYVDAVLDSKIKAIGEPKVEIKKLAAGNDLEFEATVGVLPETKISGWEKDVKKINEKYQDKKVEVKKEQVDKEVGFLANQRAKVVTVKREAKEGDQVEIDFQALQKNVPLENGTAKKHPLVLGDGKFIPGFEDKLIGAKVGDEKEFELKFPEKYQQKNLAGQKATFKVKINLVQKRQVPKIDDEFAKEIGKFKSLDELKNNIKEGIEHEEKHRQEEEQKKEIIESIVEKADFVVPKVLIDEEVHHMSHELENDIARMGLTKEKYLEQIKMTDEKLEKQWQKNEGPKRVKAALILRHLAEENEISPKAEEIEERVNQALQYYSTMGQAEDKVDAQRVYETMKGNLTNEKVFKYLMGL